MNFFTSATTLLKNFYFIFISTYNYLVLIAEKSLSNSRTQTTPTLRYLIFIAEKSLSNRIPIYKELIY